MLRAAMVEAEDNGGGGSHDGAGRARIEAAYSLRVHAPAVVSVFEKAARSVHAHA